MSNSADKNFLDGIRVHWTLPDVVADRCVHSRIETASCRNCVDVCPQKAWVIDDERLGIDSEACDGCQLCAAVCPEEAILNEVAPEIRSWNDDTVAFAACEYAPGVSSSNRLPCLNSISIKALALLRRQGVNRLMVVRGDCATCFRNVPDSLDQRVQQLNRLLDDRGLNAFSLVEVPASHWAGVLRMTETGGSLGAMLGRRSFLRAGFAEAVDRGFETMGLPASRDAENDDPAVSAGSLIPRRHPKDIALFVPHLDERSCEGCDACLSVCAHNAIRLESSAYLIDSDACSGCMACVDVCVVQAVSVHRRRRPDTDRVPLAELTCDACGADFHMPAVQVSGQSVGLCQVCRKTNHHSRLYQVLD